MSDTVSASAKGATLLILQQFGSRILTFAANQVLLRYLSPELLGISAQLELYSISCLFFSRESIRVALQRQATGTQTVINLAYFAPLIGSPLCCFFYVIYVRAGLPPVAYFGESLGLFALATVVELSTEPFFAVVQQKLLYEVRASVESAATVARCLATCAFVIWSNTNDKHLGALPFALGQIVYSISLFGFYFSQLNFMSFDKPFSLMPIAVSAEEIPEYYFKRFSKQLTWLIGTISLQSAIKYVLTQGDSILVVSLTTLREQGSYALASNYGGLVARIVFQPVEESSRNLFAKLCAPTKSKKPQLGKIAKASQLLTMILRFYSAISIYAFTFGPSLAPVLLNIVAGSRWTDVGAGDVLASYCYYVPFLAINGVTEAFVAVVASPSELNKQSAYMAVNFAAFAASAYLFLARMQLGGRGLIFANCLNMFLRIVWNLSFIQGYFSASKTHFEITDSLPPASAVLGAAMIPQILKREPSVVRRYGSLGSLAWGAMTAILYTIFYALIERDYFRRVYKLVKAGGED